MNDTFEGTGVAIVTPFNDDLSIDFNSFENIIEHVIAGNVNYIVALGTTGETATLTGDEKNKIIDFCKEKIDNRIPLVIGSGGYNTVELVNNIKSINKEGIAGILSVAPYYNKPSQKGLYKHFSAIAEVCELPLIIYNVPGRTCSNISAATAVKLAEDYSNIVAIKEASGNFSQIMQILKNKPERFSVLSGDDALTLPMISLGAKGVISVVANSHPKEFSTLVNSALQGDFTRAGKYQYKLIDYINSLFTEGSPSGIKAALNSMGLCKNNVRLPLEIISDAHKHTIEKLLETI